MVLSLHAKNVACRPHGVTCGQKGKAHRQKMKTEAAFLGLSEFLALAHHQGAVQYFEILYFLNSMSLV